MIPSTSTTMKPFLHFPRKLSSHVSPLVDEKALLYYGRKKQTGVSLKNLMDTANGAGLDGFAKHLTTSAASAGIAAKVNIQVRSRKFDIMLNYFSLLCCIVV